MSIQLRGRERAQAGETNHPIDYRAEEVNIGSAVIIGIAHIPDVELRRARINPLAAGQEQQLTPMAP
jgi:hypothetical protein